MQEGKGMRRTHIPKLSSHRTLYGDIWRDFIQPSNFVVEQTVSRKGSKTDIDSST